MKRVLVLVVLGFAAPAPGQMTAGVEAPQPNVESHVVEPGDTLWDLTASVFGDPFLWPRVWSYNPEITNPHWIYPGDVIRFYPSDEGLPSQAELIADHRQMPEIEEEPEPEAIPDVAVIETAPVRRANAAPIQRFVGLFVTPKELKEAGTLANSRADKILFGPGDEVYFTFPPGAPQPNPGERFMIYRTLGEIVHPKNEERFGYMTQVTGIASIVALEKKVARARLLYTVVEVERGQYVAPLMPDILSRVTPTPAASRIEGVVLAVQYNVGEIAAEHQVVFVDRGTNDGIQRGNRFQVVTQGDPLTGLSQDMPVYAIAMLTVVQANDTASTCLVTDSRREIEPGDTGVTVVQ